MPFIGRFCRFTEKVFSHHAKGYIFGTILMVCNIFLFESSMLNVYQFLIVFY